MRRLFILLAQLLLSASNAVTQEPPGPTIWVQPQIDIVSSNSLEYIVNLADQGLYDWIGIESTKPRPRGSELYTNYSYVKYGSPVQFRSASGVDSQPDSGDNLAGLTELENGMMELDKWPYTENWWYWLETYNMVKKDVPPGISLYATTCNHGTVNSLFSASIRKKMHTTCNNRCVPKYEGILYYGKGGLTCNKTAVFRNDSLYIDAHQVPIPEFPEIGNPMGLSLSPNFMKQFEDDQRGGSEYIVCPDENQKDVLMNLYAGLRYTDTSFFSTDNVECVKVPGTNCYDVSHQYTDMTVERAAASGDTVLLKELRAPPEDPDQCKHSSDPEVCLYAYLNTF